MAGKAVGCLSSTWSILFQRYEPYVNPWSQSGGVLNNVLKNMTTMCCGIRDRNFHYHEISDGSELVRNQSLLQSLTLFMPAQKSLLSRCDDTNENFITILESPGSAVIAKRGLLASDINMFSIMLQGWPVAILIGFMCLLVATIVWSINMRSMVTRTNRSILLEFLANLSWTVLLTPGSKSNSQKQPIGALVSIQTLGLFLALMCFVLITIFQTAVTSSVTEAVLRRNIFDGKSVGVISHSPQFTEAVKLGAKVVEYNNVGSIIEALNEGQLNLGLVDFYAVQAKTDDLVVLDISIVDVTHNALEIGMFMGNVQSELVKCFKTYAHWMKQSMSRDLLNAVRKPNKVVARERFNGVETSKSLLGIISAEKLAILMSFLFMFMVLCAAWDIFYHRKRNAAIDKLNHGGCEFESYGSNCLRWFLNSRLGGGTTKIDISTSQVASKLSESVSSYGYFNLDSGTLEYGSCCKRSTTSSDTLGSSLKRYHSVDCLCEPMKSNSWKPVDPIRRASLLERSQNYLVSSSASGSSNIYGSTPSKSLLTRANPKPDDYSTTGYTEVPLRPEVWVGNDIDTNLSSVSIQSFYHKSPIITRSISELPAPINRLRSVMESRAIQEYNNSILNTVNNIPVPKKRRSRLALPEVYTSTPNNIWSTSPNGFKNSVRYSSPQLHRQGIHPSEMVHF